MILISPWSAKTSDGKPSPKNYPFWREVVVLLRAAGYEVTQVSRSGEPDVPGTSRLDDLSFSKIAELIMGCDTWISVDNFWHHFAWTLKRPGVVLFGLSDPLIFGHPENCNLLKSRKLLRHWQFRHWNQVSVNVDAFVPPEEAVAAVKGLAEAWRTGR